MQTPIDANEPEAAQIFYGWQVVYALCLVTTFTSGLIFYNLSVLLDAFVTERGFRVGLSSIATAAFFIAAGVAGLIAGHLIDRIDARVVMMVSACTGVLALGCVGLLREPWQLFLFYVAFGCSCGGLGVVHTSTIVARWFQARRPQALAVAFTGSSIGGILITPLAALLIKQSGLAGAAPWLAAALFLGIVPVTGGYTAAYGAVAPVWFVGFVIVAMSNPPRLSPKRPRISQMLNQPSELQLTLGRCHG